jgi:hypothetical protein
MSYPFGKVDLEFAAVSNYAAYYKEKGLAPIPSFTPDEVGWIKNIAGHWQAPPNPTKTQLSWKRPVPKWRDLPPVLTEEIFHKWFGKGGLYVSRKHQLGHLTFRSADRVFVIDLDTHKTPEAAIWWQLMEEMQQKGGELEAPEIITGGGGRQLLFRAPPGWTPPTNKTNYGVDIRGKGGFAVLPPSVHESGRLYEWKDGLALDDFKVIPEAPAWLCEQIDQLVAESGGGPAPRDHVHTATPHDGAENIFGRKIDGREWEATKIAFRTVVNAYRECPISPSLSEIEKMVNSGFTVYLDRCKSRLPIGDPGSNAERLEREGRGYTMFQRKILDLMPRWATFVATEAAKPNPFEEASPNKDPFEEARKEQQQEQEPPQQAAGGDSSPPPPPPPPPPDEEAEFSGAAQPKQEAKSKIMLYDLDQIEAMRDPVYLVDGVIAEDALGFVFGAPGCGKSFLALSLALAIAFGMKEWFGKGIAKNGPVVYISSEGQSDMKNRIRAWKKKFKFDHNDAPFRLIIAPLNFMQPEDVIALQKAVSAAVAGMGGKPVMFVVDTVSRVLPGADENLQKDMTLFVRACDFLRTSFGAAVMGVHHTSRNGNMRGSSVFDGAADFMLQIEREKQAQIGLMTAAKIKTAMDGWELEFELEQIEVRPLTGATSLVAIPVSKDAPKKLTPDLARKIRQAIHDAWQMKNPWSSAIQTRATGRYAIDHMVRDFGLPVIEAEQLLKDWLFNGVIKVEMVSTDTKQKGLKVMLWD